MYIPATVITNSATANRLRSARSHRTKERVQRAAGGTAQRRKRYSRMPSQRSARHSHVRRSQRSANKCLKKSSITAKKVRFGGSGGGSTSLTLGRLEGIG